MLLSLIVVIQLCVFRPQVHEEPSMMTVPKPSLRSPVNKEPPTIPEQPVFISRSIAPRTQTATNSIVGYLQHTSGTLYPLYASPSPTYRYRFNYHTVTSPNDTHFKLPIVHNKRDCTERFGCDELYDGTIVTVPGVEGLLTVKMYSRDFMN